MSRLTDQEVDTAARRMLTLLRPLETGAEAISPPKEGTAPLRKGVIYNVDLAVYAAHTAHHALMGMTLAKRDEIIASVRSKMLEHSEELARMAHEETGLGRIEDKIAKNRLVTTKTPGTEVLEPVAHTGDRGLTLIEPAPYGVIGAITPVTNPTSTIICNTIGMVAAGNAVVFNVHPGAKEVSFRNIELLNEAITEAGGPLNLVTTIATPTIESAQELMKHPNVRLLVVTGGAAVVREAMTSGKRAVCAGPGNPPVVVDETADLDQAAKQIVFGASMDNNIICVDEKEVFVVESVADELLERMQSHGAALVPRERHDQLERLIFSDRGGPRKHGVINKELIGKNAQLILSRIGMSVDAGIRLAIMEVDENHPLVWTEQMLPVLPIVRVPDVDTGIDLAKEAEQGFGHSAVMYSKNLDNLSRMARVMNTSIFVKNGPAVSGLGYGGEGFSSFSIASPTGEGLTDPRSFSRGRRCVLVDHFRIV